MKAYYGDRFSPHMTKTPEGYLICHDVPIARTGTQQYLPKELGLEGEGLITVFRNGNEVFKPAAVASFEGKPVTDNHPPVDVMPDNYSIYTKGVVQNVRRGNGDLQDKILADLIIYDANLIAEIESGKREISCGYDCLYKNNNDGTYYQANIIGNHVAVVDNGRAGAAVSIRDEKPKGDKQVNKKDNIFKRMYNTYIKNAEPDEIAEATRALDSMENCNQAENPPKTEDNDPIAKLTDAVNTLCNRMDALEQNMQPKTETNSLDELESELAGEKTADEPDESSVTVAPEQINDEDEISGEEPEHVAPATTDKAVALNIVRAMKPVVATLPKEQRKKMADSLSKIVRDAMQVKSTQKFTGGYGALAKPKKTVDSVKLMNDRQAFGENCRKRNPHFNGGK